MSYVSTQQARLGGETAIDHVVVPTHLVAAVLSTVFCFVPTGLAAVVSAGQVRAFLAAGDVEAAQRASRRAARFCWISLSVSVMFLLVIVVGADGYSSSH